MRHPGAGRFARSSTVQINVLVLGEILDFLIEIVRLDPDRSKDPLRAPVIVTMAADIRDQYPSSTLHSQSRRQFLNLHPRHPTVNAAIAELHRTVTRVCGQR